MIRAEGCEVFVGEEGGKGKRKRVLNLDLLNRREPTEKERDVEGLKNKLKCACFIK